MYERYCLFFKLSNCNKQNQYKKGLRCFTIYISSNKMREILVNLSTIQRLKSIQEWIES